MFPKDDLRSGTGHFWRYQWRVLRRAGWPAFLRDAAIGIIAGLATMATDWVPVVVGVGLGLLLYACDLARASARLDKDAEESADKASERIRLLTGGFSDEDIRKTAADRMQLYKAAWEVYNAWVMLWNKAMRGTGEEMGRGLAVVEDRIREFRRLLPASDLDAIKAYHGPLTEIDDVLVSDSDAFHKAGELENPMMELANAARADQWWDMRRRGVDPITGERLPGPD